MQRSENQTESIHAGKKIVRIGVTGLLISIVISQLMTQVAIIIFQDSESPMRVINVVVQLIGFIFPALFASMIAIGLFASKLGVTVPAHEEPQTRVFRNSVYAAIVLVVLGILSLFGLMGASFGMLDNQLLDIVMNIIGVVSIYFGLPFAGVLAGTAISFRVLRETSLR